MVCGLQRNALTQKTGIAARWQLWLSMIFMSDHRGLVITASKHTQPKRRSIPSQKSNLPLTDMSQSRAKKPHNSHFSFLGDCSEHRHFIDRALLTTTPQLSVSLYSYSNIHPLYVLWTKKKKKSSSRTLQTAVQRSKEIYYYMFSYVAQNLSNCFSARWKSQQNTSATACSAWAVPRHSCLPDWFPWVGEEERMYFGLSQKKAIQKLSLLTSSTLSRGPTAAISDLLHSLLPPSFFPL